MKVKMGPSFSAGPTARRIDALARRPEKTVQEGQEYQETLTQLPDVPLSLLIFRSALSFPPGSSVSKRGTRAKGPVAWGRPPG